MASAFRGEKAAAAANAAAAKIAGIFASGDCLLAAITGLIERRRCCPHAFVLWGLKATCAQHLARELIRTQKYAGFVHTRALNAALNDHPAMQQVASSQEGMEQTCVPLEPRHRGDIIMMTTFFSGGVSPKYLFRFMQRVMGMVLTCLRSR